MKTKDTHLPTQAPILRAGLVEHVVCLLKPVFKQFYLRLGLHEQVRHP